MKRGAQFVFALPPALDRVCVRYVTSEYLRALCGLWEHRIPGEKPWGEEGLARARWECREQRLEIHRALLLRQVWFGEGVCGKGTQDPRQSSSSVVAWMSLNPFDIPCTEWGQLGDTSHLWTAKDNASTFALLYFIKILTYFLNGKPVSLAL